jgi:hypothetical protein
MYGDSEYQMLSQMEDGASTKRAMFGWSIILKEAVDQDCQFLQTHSMQPTSIYGAILLLREPKVQT